MNKSILYILLLILASCSSSNTNTSNGNNYILDSIPKKIEKPVTTKAKIDFYALKGNWIPISMHYNNIIEILGGWRGTLGNKKIKNNGDTNIQSFYRDTAMYNFRLAVLDNFDSTGRWHSLESNIISSGSYVIDSNGCRIEIVDSFPITQHDAALYSGKIVYLDKKYMLLERTNEKTKYISFFLKTKSIPPNFWRR